MPADRLRPEDIDAAIAASRGQNRRQNPRLDPTDLTPLEVSYRTRASRGPEAEGSRADPGMDDPEIPPYPDRRRPDIVYAAGDLRSGERRRGRLWSMLAAGFALGLFAVVVWWAYGTKPAVEPGPAPLITADSGPEKIRPEDEGGLQVPFQDKLIYSEIGPNGDPDAVERLLPPPATPMEPPIPPAAAPEPAVPEPETAAESRATGGGTQDAPSPPAAPATAVEAAPLGEVAGVEPAQAEGVGPSQAEPETIEPAEQVKPAETEVAAPEPAAPPPMKPEPPAAAAVAATAPATAPTTTPAADAFRVQLAALRTPEAARTAWDNIRGRHSALLEPLRLNVVRADLGDKGVFYRVQAGPLPDLAAAETLCAELKQRDQACLVVKP